MKEAPETWAESEWNPLFGGRQAQGSETLS